MSKLLVVLALLCVTGCGTVAALISPPVDPRPAKNLAHVERLVAKDADPADAVVNVDAVQNAQEIVAEGSKSPAEQVLRAIATTAPNSALPWGEILGVVSTVGVAVLGGLHTKNARAIKAKGTAPAAQPVA